MMKRDGDMAKIKKQDTAMVSTRLAKRVSLFNGNFEPEPNNEGWSWGKQVVEADEDGAKLYRIKVSTRRKVDGLDGKYFDYAFSKLQAINKKRKDQELEPLTEIELDLGEMCRVSNIASRYENKVAIADRLGKMVGFEVEIRANRKKVTFGLVRAVEVKDETNTVRIVFEMKYGKFLEGEGAGRFINMSRSMPLKSPFDVELAKFLTITGSGLDGGLNPKVRQGGFTISEITQFAHLEGRTMKTIIDTVERALRRLHTQAGYPRYKRGTVRGSKGGAYGDGGQPMWTPIKDSQTW